MSDKNNPWIEASPENSDLLKQLKEDDPVLAVVEQFLAITDDPEDFKFRHLFYSVVYWEEKERCFDIETEKNDLNIPKRRVIRWKKLEALVEALEQ